MHLRIDRNTFLLSLAQKIQIRNYPGASFYSLGRHKGKIAYQNMLHNTLHDISKFSGKQI